MSVSSLMDMFSGQKDNIAAAMPSGFVQQLSASDTIANTASSTVSEVNDVAEEATSTAGAWFARLLPLALLCGVAWFAYNQFSKSSIEIPESTTIPQSTTDTIIKDVLEPPKVIVQDQQVNVNVKEELSVLLGSVTNSLGSITDVASANEAIPQLNTATEKLGGLANILTKLPAAAREPVKLVISGGLPQLQALVDKVVAIPGVGPVIKPVTDGLLQKIALLEQ